MLGEKNLIFHLFWMAETIPLTVGIMTAMENGNTRIVVFGSVHPSNTKFFTFTVFTVSVIPFSEFSNMGNRRVQQFGQAGHVLLCGADDGGLCDRLHGFSHGVVRAPTIAPSRVECKPLFIVGLFDSSCTSHDEDGTSIEPNQVQ